MILVIITGDTFGAFRLWLQVTPRSCVLPLTRLIAVGHQGYLNFSCAESFRRLSDLRVLIPLQASLETPIHHGGSSHLIDGSKFGYTAA